MSTAPKFSSSWSVTKADAAEQCLRKFKAIYVDKQGEKTAALELGDSVHKLIAGELISGRVSNLEVLSAKLDSLGADPELYALLPHIHAYLTRWRDYCERYSISKPHVEEKHAITRDGRKTNFFNDDAYIRVGLDLWAFDPLRKRVIITDHKTSKVIPASNDDLKKHRQLMLYCWVFGKICGFKWDHMLVILNGLRHGKLLQTLVMHDEIMAFGNEYLDTLRRIEENVLGAHAANDWPATPGDHCKICSVNCPGRSGSK